MTFRATCVAAGAALFTAGGLCAWGVYSRIGDSTPIASFERSMLAVFAIICTIALLQLVVTFIDGRPRTNGRRNKKAEGGE